MSRYRDASREARGGARFSSARFTTAGCGTLPAGPPPFPLAAAQSARLAVVASGQALEVSEARRKEVPADLGEQDGAVVHHHHAQREERGPRDRGALHARREEARHCRADQRGVRRSAQHEEGEPQTKPASGRRGRLAGGRRLWRALEHAQPEKECVRLGELRKGDGEQRDVVVERRRRDDQEDGRGGALESVGAELAVTHSLPSAGGVAAGGRSDHGARGRLERGGRRRALQQLDEAPHRGRDV
eukprot:CAMPEP_0196706940 /NCGR_PEP_ID=MMETSP1090-20130531/62972_1 /TAXON_ID=37098 /ORGANISM="Isochrysis sp, Strain CCMP1244" /LENGTH=244 /DNA_ID=CAMNT_0042046897 /DNA_START=434 /DNA_END=1165 /DNA_ORIENTATION=+